MLFLLGFIAGGIVTFLILLMIGISRINDANNGDEE